MGNAEVTKFLPDWLYAVRRADVTTRSRLQKTGKRGQKGKRGQTKRCLSCMVNNARLA